MNEWINVKDRILPKDGRYLVFCDYGNDSTWMGVCSLRHGVFDDIKVTHWKSLPEAPEEK